MSVSHKSVNVLGVPVVGLRVDELHDYIAQSIASGRKSIILNVNAHALNLAYRDRWLRRFFNCVDLVICDGAGVMLAARMLGHRIPARITYADWMWQLAEFAQPRGISFFFLGGRPGVAQKASERLKKRFPGLQVVGTHHGYFDKARGSHENESVIEAINSVKPNILIVGFGMPLQEHWLKANWKNLEANVALTGGGAFDYVSGKLRRGPRWMTDYGLEWLARMIIEPRLWRRYLIGNPLFLWRVFKQRLGRVSLQ